MANQYGTICVRFDELLQINYVTIDMLKYRPIDLRIMTWNKLPAFGHFAASARTGFRNYFTGHFHFLHNSYLKMCNAGIIPGQSLDVPD